MPRFFIDSADMPTDGYCLRDRIHILGEDASHISRSLRMKAGESLVLCDCCGRDYYTVIESISGGEVIARVEEVQSSRGEPPYRVTVYQGLLKGDKMDTVVQKSVELGAELIIPVRCKNSVAKLDDEAAKKKILRWQKIASEAAKQCGRGKLPRVGMPLSFDEMKGEMKSCDVTFACYEAEKQHSVKQLLKRDFGSISFFIGPEGGLSPEECESLASSCIPLVTLGTRILRAETAAATVLSMLAYEKEL